MYVRCSSLSNGIIDRLVNRLFDGSFSIRWSSSSCNFEMRKNDDGVRERYSGGRGEERKKVESAHREAFGRIV